MKIRFVVLMIVMAVILIFMTQCSAATTVAPVNPGTTNDNPAPSALDGQALVQKACTSCHTVSRIQNAGKTADDWKTTVQRMVGKGAQLNADEQQAVIDYLAKTYPK
jgi:cytochrome c5